MRICLIVLACLAASGGVGAQQTEVQKEGWSNETEISLVAASGNTDAETYSARERTNWVGGANELSNTARYLRQTSAGVESARKWDLGLRYNRAIRENWGLFVGYLIESDPYSGFIQRNSGDFGSRNWLVREPEFVWSVEAGVRTSDTYTNLGVHEYANFARLYSGVERKLETQVSVKLWAEYLSNLRVKGADLANAEVSVAVTLTRIFSMKLAYLANHQAVPPADATDKLDTLFTTALVAKF